MLKVKAELVCYVILLLFVSMTQASGSPHVVSRQTPPAGCTVCHESAPELNDDKPVSSKNLPVDWTRLTQDGVAMCAACHDVNAYHKVGLKVDFPIPADLPLNPDNEIVCPTCHYTHGKLESDRPQASYSFMDRWLGAERLRKSFLLRRNNSEGELCLACHNSDQGSKP